MYVFLYIYIYHLFDAFEYRYAATVILKLIKHILKDLHQPLLQIA